jgi:hypothetical protein
MKMGPLYRAQEQFKENPGDPHKALDASATFQLNADPIHYFPLEVRPSLGERPQFFRARWHYAVRGSTGAPGSFVPGFTPDLVKNEGRLNLAILVKF